MIDKRRARTGDRSEPDENGNCLDENNNVDEKMSQKISEADASANYIWGWDDTDMKAEDKCSALILNQSKPQSS